MNHGRSIARCRSLNCAAAAVAFIATCLLLHALAPFPDVPEVREKLEYFTRHRDEFDAVFVGSSRIRHGIVPKIFDQTLREKGRTLRSFNLGIVGMHPPETFAMLREILMKKPQRLKWIFIELAALHTEIPQRMRGTVRETYWHGWTETALLFRMLWLPEKHEHFFARARRMTCEWLPHFQMMACNYTCFGRGPEIFFHIRAPAGVDSDEALARDAGFVSLGENSKIMPDIVAEYEREVRQLNEGSAKKDAGENIFRAELKGYEHRFATHGVTSIFVVPPTSYVVNKHVLARNDDERRALFAFDDPAKFSTLYALSARRDYDHLRGSGAEAFTRLLAARFANFLDETRTEKSK